MGRRANRTASRLRGAQTTGGSVRFSGAPGRIFSRRGRRWRARRPTCRRTRLPYESRPPRAAVARRPAPPLKRSGWSTLASTSVRVGSTNSRGRPRPAGEKRRAVAKRVCWAGAPAPNGAPRLRNDRCRARIELPSRRRVRLHTGLFKCRPIQGSYHGVCRTQLGMAIAARRVTGGIYVRRGAASHGS